MSENSFPNSNELDNYLFKCADKIRNAVDTADYKHYILPLVFYKAISDTYKERYKELHEKALEKFEDEELAEDYARDEAYHDFQIPRGYAWDDLLEVNKNIDQFLNEAFEKLEEANPDRLKGVFRADFVEAEALDDTKLRSLIQHLDTKNLSREKIPPHTLGESYMHLVRHFAEQEGKSGGEFFTPPKIVKLIVRLLAPFEKGDEFHDPTCGSAGMLIKAAKHFRDEQRGEPKKLRLTGQEINPDIAAIARMNLFLHGYNGEIRREDSLNRPQFTENGELEKFDYVLANFPFSADWPKYELKDDKYNRFDWADKRPRKDRADYAFIQHMVAQLKNDGKLGVVIPHGVLFRTHESVFRKYLIEKDWIEAVIGLPKNLFQNNSIPCAVLVINKDKPKQGENEILFLHAADEEFYHDKSRQNELKDKGTDHIVENYRKWKTEKKVSRVVSHQEIEENDYNLNISLYVDTTEPEEDIDVSKELKKLKKLQEERKEIEKRMDKHMKVLGYE